ncbi:hypothetical protein COCON_G00205960 [Conger conger]|uniref:Uncharacterized protein n=1 Tax=Conger conger TaxID=82655 RepID=A0A9Q1CZK6_CONCO|nr:hypothetical protein COCON_G00205960 [Conger conger]
MRRVTKCRQGKAKRERKKGLMRNDSIDSGRPNMGQIKANVDISRKLRQISMSPFSGCEVDPNLHCALCKMFRNNQSACGLVGRTPFKKLI